MQVVKVDGAYKLQLAKHETKRFVEVLILCEALEGQHKDAKLAAQCIRQMLVDMGVKSPTRPPTASEPVTGKESK